MRSPSIELSLLPSPEHRPRPAALEVAAFFFLTFSSHFPKCHLRASIEDRLVTTENIEDDFEGTKCNWNGRGGMGRKEERRGIEGTTRNNKDANEVSRDRFEHTLMDHEEFPGPK